MNISRLALVAVLLILCSCSSVPIVGSLSPQTARRQAQRDFASGHSKLYEAGGYASYVPGIEGYEALVAKLPRDASLAGCTNPKVGYSDGFATAYNKEIVLLLQRHGIPPPR